MNYYEMFWNELKESGDVNIIPAFGRKCLCESNLGRILSHYEKDGFLIISACRDEYTEAENNKKTLELQKYLRQSYINKKIGYVPLYGGFVENINGEPVKVDKEISFLVIFTENTTWNMFLKIGLYMCDKFNQDCILVSEPNKKETYWMDRNGNKIKTFDSVSIEDDESIYYSRLKKGSHSSKKFVFKGEGKSFVTLGALIPETLNGKRMCEEFSGEISGRWPVEKVLK